LELAILQYRRRREINSELTQQQNEALDQFLDEYTNALAHITAWDGHKSDAASERVDDASAQGVQQAFERSPSAYSSAIVTICQQMVASLLSLRRNYVG
jgi:hypothetical protein